MPTDSSSPAKSRQKILVITQIPLWSMDKKTGGPAFSQTIFGFARTGHTIHLVTPKLDYISQTDLPDGVVLHAFKHTFHGFLIHKKKLGWLFDAAGWLVFQIKAGRIGRELLEREDFDVVYGYEVWGIPCARKLATRFRLPMVSRFQGTWMKPWLGAPLRDLRFFKHFKAFRTPADLYIMTDDGTEGDEVLQACGVDVSKVRFWRNGIEEPFKALSAEETQAARRRYGIAEDGRMLLTVCRLVRMKGVQRAIAAMPDVLAAHPHTKLVVVGEGPYRGELEALARELGVEDSVVFTGGLERSAVAEAMNATDLFLSLYDQSNVGNPLLEAMSCGKPVITRDVGATRTVVTGGSNGILLGEREDELLGETIRRLLDDEGERARLGAGGAAWASENLKTWDERIAMELDELGRLVKEGARRG